MLQIKKNSSLYNEGCFSNLSTRFCEPKKGIKKTFHETIQGSKDFIFNCFDNKPYYNELMPTIIRNNRGNQFYKKTLRKGVDGKMDHFKNIMKDIETANKIEQSKSQDKKKQIKYYKIPKLELMKRRNEQLDNYIAKRNKIPKLLRPIKKNNSMICSINLNKKSQPTSESMAKSTNNNYTINTNENKNNNNSNNNLNSSMTLETYHTNKNQSRVNFHKRNRLFKKTNSQPRHLNLSSFKKLNNKYKTRDLTNQPKLIKILDKCNEELDLAQNMGNDVEHYSFNKKKTRLELSNRIKNELKTGDQRVIEEKGFANKKYTKLEKERFNEIKKKMDIKVSEDYAYQNRKVLHDFMINNENIIAYRIYMKERDKINETIEKKKEVEKKNISMVENLLENTFRQKEFLKFKIDNYFMKNARLDELNNFNLKKKDEYYISKNNYKENLKGELLPKLIELKEYCYGMPKYNPSHDKDNLDN